MGSGGRDLRDGNSSNSGRYERMREKSLAFLSGWLRLDRAILFQEVFPSGYLGLAMYTQDYCPARKL